MIGSVIQIAITVLMFVSAAAAIVLAVLALKTGLPEEKRGVYKKWLITAVILFILACAAMFFCARMDLPGWDYEILFRPNSK